MFNKPQIHIYDHKPKNTYSSNKTTITEHRAPTDESVRLLSEMEKKAEERFIEKIRVSNNIMDGVLLRKHYNVYDNLTYYKAVFSINGTKFSIDGDMDREDFLPEKAMMKEFVKVLSQKIAIKFLTEQP